MKKVAVLFLLFAGCRPEPSEVGVGSSSSPSGGYVSTESVNWAPHALRDIVYIKDDRLSPPTCFGLIGWGNASVMASAPCDSIPAALVVAVRK